MAGKSTDIRILEVRAERKRLKYRAPMKFGGRIVHFAEYLVVEIDVENRAGNKATGVGAQPLGNDWAWKDVPGETSLEKMILLADATTGIYQACNEYGHSVDLARMLEGEVEKKADEIHSGMPKLPQLVATSAFSNALFDGMGRATELNSYCMLGEDHMQNDMWHYLKDEELVDIEREDLEGHFLGEAVTATPQERMPLFHLVGALDPLTESDIEDDRPEDSHPFTLGEWITADGLSHLKHKLNGNDLEWDVARVIGIDEVATSTSPTTPWQYSLDFNEQVGDVDYLREFLDRIARANEKLIERILYIEQPTHRDLVAYPVNVGSIADRIPVIIDESADDVASLSRARALGYSGVALKTCKCHEHALLMGYVAQLYSMFVAVQDLTCPGLAFVQSAKLSAHVKRVAAIEGNARQYMPDASTEYVESCPELFVVNDGMLTTAILNAIGA